MRSLKITALAVALALLVAAASPFGGLGFDSQPRVAEAVCSEGTFTGFWSGDDVELSTSGDHVSGTWTGNVRPPFSGVIDDDDDCVVLMTFSDANEVYTGTLEGPCRIQWSFPNQPGTVDPKNFWICSGGQISPEDEDEDEGPRGNPGGIFGGVDTAQQNRERAGIIYPTPQPAPAASAPVVRPPSTGDGGLVD